MAHAGHTPLSLLCHAEFLRAVRGHEAGTHRSQFVLPAGQAHKTPPSSSLGGPNPIMAFSPHDPEALAVQITGCDLKGKKFVSGKRNKNKQTSRDGDLSVAQLLVVAPPLGSAGQTSSSLCGGSDPLNACHPLFSRVLTDTVLPRPRGPAIAVSPRFTGRTEPSCSGD